MEDIGAVLARGNSPLLKMWRVCVPGGIRPYRKHNHIHFEITLVEGGSGTYQVGQHTYEMTPGCMFVFASNEEHCITRVGDEGLTMLNLHFEPKYLWGSSMDSLSEEGIHICFTHNKTFSHCIRPEHAAPLKDIYMKMYEELQGGDKEWGLVVKSYLNLFLICLIRDFDYAVAGKPLSRDKLRSIRRGIQYIDAHLTEKLTLGDICDYVGISPNYFSGLFHQVSGMTLWEYINSKRIDKAVYMLHTEDKNILEIALSAGFNNTANFNKAFKKHTGMTPREYQKTGEINLS